MINTNNIFCTRGVGYEDIEKHEENCEFVRALIRTARVIRFATVRSFLDVISEEDAIEILRGPLSPGKKAVDDSHLLYDPRAIEKIIQGHFDT